MASLPEPVTYGSISGVVQVWQGYQGTPPLLIINSDTVNTVYLGYRNSIAAMAPNAIPLGPGQSVVIDGSRTLWCVGNNAGPLVIIPGGTSFFQPTTLNNIGGAKVFVQDTKPNGSSFPVNSVWFDTGTNSLLTWDGTNWVERVFNAQNIILPATILANQIASLSASLIGPVGTANPNPYFTGGDGAGWTGYQGTFTVTNSPPAGAPYPYAGVYVNNGVSGGAMEETGGAFNTIAGNQYAISAWVYSTTGNVRIGFDFRENGSYVSTQASNFTVPVNTWSPISTVETAPANTNSAYARVGSVSPDSGTTMAQAIIVSGQVPGTLIQPGSLTTAQIAAAAGILGTQIANATITSGNIAANTIVAANIAAATITAAQIAAATITGGNIAASTITGNNIAANTITAANIKANTITAAQLAANIIYAGIVNGTTIQGAQLIGTGSGQEVLAYTGSPALGNLIASISATSGTDSKGNTVYDGLASYGPNGGIMQAAANQTTGTPYVIFHPPNAIFLNTWPQIYGASLNPGVGNEQEELIITSGYTSGQGSGSDASINLISTSDNGSFIARALLNLPNGIGGTLTPVKVGANSLGTTITVSTTWQTFTTVWDIAQIDYTQAGTVYRLKCAGNMSTVNVSVAAGYNFRIIGLGGTFAEVQLGAGFFPANANFSWWMEAAITVSAVSGAGLFYSLRGGISQFGVQLADTSTVSFVGQNANVNIPTGARSMAIQVAANSSSGNNCEFTMFEETFQKYGPNPQNA